VLGSAGIVMFILGNKGMHMTQDILLKEEPEKIICKKNTTPKTLYKIVALQHQTDMKIIIHLIITITISSHVIGA